MHTLLNDGDGFAGTYTDARRAWLTAVAARGGYLSGLQHPGVGPGGEALWLDVARFGDPQARSAFVVSCGTHERRRMQRAHLALAWMRRQRAGGEAFDRAAAEYREAFFPSDPEWRASVLREGVALCQRGRDALVAEVR